MFTIIFSLFSSIRQSLRDRVSLQAEILALRHQLFVLQRSSRARRLRLTTADRLLWVWLSRLWNGWRSALVNTSVVFALSHLPIPQVVAAPPPALPVRNLIRGWRLGLPTGQHVAKAMGVAPMADKDILIGKGVDKQDPGDPLIVSIDKISPVFANNCPLWTYMLAEAMNHQIKVQIPVDDQKTITTPQLGPVGGRIVAEVFLGLMFGDNHSLLSADPTWQPQHTSFALKDFVNYALGN
jgi:hypothetical protein